MELKEVETKKLTGELGRRGIVCREKEAAQEEKDFFFVLRRMCELISEYADGCEHWHNTKEELRKILSE